MKTVILCGGKGSRLGELTQGLIPKPMVEIGGIPILHHIMKYYSSFGHKDFILCSGYLGWAIKNYFLHLREREHDLIIDFSSGEVSMRGGLDRLDWKITVADTGQNTMTAGRLRQVLPYLDDDESFMLTYGDGLSNINLDELYNFHIGHGRGLTISGVLPPGRFGEMAINGDAVTDWTEKPNSSDRYINGGFMVMRKDFVEKFVSPYSDEVMLEREPFERAATEGQMMIFRHNGFWQCMDTPRDWEYLQSVWTSGDSPWVVGSQRGLK